MNAEFVGCDFIDNGGSPIEDGVEEPCMEDEYKTPALNEDEMRRRTELVEKARKMAQALEDIFQEALLDGLFEDDGS